MEEITLLDPQPKAADTYLPTAAKPAPVAVVTAAVATMEEATLAHFAEMRATVTVLAERYRAVAYDVATTKGMTDAKAARHVLREEGIYAVQRIETAVKRKVNDLKSTVADTAAELVAIIKPIEVSIDKQIKAREDFLTAEKERLATIERQRKEAHEVHIAKIRGYLAQAVGRSSDVILSGIQVLEARAFPASEWEEYAETAVAARDQVCVTLREMAATAAKAEAEAAELERVKAEQDAAWLKFQADAAKHRLEVEAEQAEMARQRAEIAVERKRLADEKAAADAAAQKALDDAAMAQKAEALQQLSDINLEIEAAELAAHVVFGDVTIEAAAGEPGELLPTAEFAPTLMVRDFLAAALPEGVHLPSIGAMQEASAIPPAPPINLSTIRDRLGFALTREFIEMSLGISCSHREKSAVLWPATAWPAICAGLIEHINGLPGAAS